MKNNVKKIIIVTFCIYLFLVFFYAFINEMEFRDKLYCCGIYGYTERIYLPFPIVNFADEGLPNIILYKNIFLNLITPLIFISLFIIKEKRRKEKVKK